MSWLDLNLEEYRFRWQCHFGHKSRTPANMVRALGGQSYISKVRAMRRWVQQGAKPSQRECLQYFRGAGSGFFPGRWLIGRNSHKLLRAIDREEPRTQIVRRGLFDPLRLHQAYRGYLKENARVNRLEKLRRSRI